MTAEEVGALGDWPLKDLAQREIARLLRDPVQESTTLDLACCELCRRGRMDLWKMALASAKAPATHQQPGCRDLVDR